jgi:hypothetical protein
MACLARRHPHYAWDHNCGYATRRHINALQSHGPCAHHRQSFVVKALLPGGEMVLEVIESSDADHIAAEFVEGAPAM